MLLIHESSSKGILKKDNAGFLIECFSFLEKTSLIEISYLVFNSFDFRVEILIHYSILRKRSKKKASIMEENMTRLAQGVGDRQCDKVVSALNYFVA